jgi:hypothetical protein
MGFEGALAATVPIGKRSPLAARRSITSFASPARIPEGLAWQKRVAWIDIAPLWLIIIIDIIFTNTKPWIS